jgi:hypothetical protein
MRASGARFNRSWAGLTLLAVGLLAALTFGFSTSPLKSLPGGEFYDALALRLLKGHWDVPFQAIGTEALVLEGKYYGYFGPAPALLRMVPLLVAPALNGRLSQLSVLAAIVCLIVYGCRLARLCEGDASAGGRNGRADPMVVFALLIGLGSPALFMAARTYVYHEALAWGAAFALAAFYHLSRIAAGTGGRVDLLAAGLCMGLAVLARPQHGAGPTVALALICIGALAASKPGIALFAYRNHLARLIGGRTSQFNHVPAGFALVAAVPLIYAASNYARFGDYFNFPLSLHIRLSPERLADVGNSGFHVENVPGNVLAYLSPMRIGFVADFPFVDFAVSAPCECPSARIDAIEASASLFATTPALLVLALAGTWLALKGRQSSWLRPALGGAALIPLPVLLFIGVSHRYLVDFLPLLIVGAANAIAYLRAHPPRRLLMMPLYALVAYSVLVNLALAARFQGEIVWGVPERARAAYQRLKIVLTPGNEALVSSLRRKLAGRPEVRSAPGERITVAYRDIALQLPALPGFCHAVAARDELTRGFGAAKPFLQPIAILVPCRQDSGGTAGRPLVVATKFVPRPVEASPEQYFGRLASALRKSETTGCALQPDVQARLACYRRFDEPAREYPLGLVGSYPYGVLFASAWSESHNPPPFSGIMAGAITLVGSLPIYVYQFSAERTADELERLASRVRSYSEVIHAQGRLATGARHPALDLQPAEFADLPASGTALWSLDGWSDPDASGARWTAKHADALLTVPAGEAGAGLFLDGIAGPVPYTVRLYVDGTQVHAESVGPGQPIKVLAPVGHSFSGRVVRVTVEVSKAWSPAALGLNQDTRNLGVYVRALGFRHMAR